MQPQAQPSSGDITLQFQSAMNQVSQCFLAMAQQLRTAEMNNRTLQNQNQTYQKDIETLQSRLGAYEKMPENTRIKTGTTTISDNPKKK